MKRLSFNTLRNYTPLKQEFDNKRKGISFNTLRNYTPLKHGSILKK